MTKKNNNNKQAAHVFKGCRDALMNVSPRAAPGVTIFPVSSDASGNSNAAFILTPVGLTSVTLASNVYTQGATGNVFPPVLRGLYNRAVDFQWYRVTRAKLVFVSNQGSNCVGRMTMAAYSDPADVSVVAYDSYVSGPGTKTFDVSAAANKDMSIPIPVDSSWKKVATYLSIVGNVYPFVGGNTNFVVQNTVGDLAFGAVAYNLAGFGPGTTPAVTGNVGTFYIDYDVEFKGVIDSFVNS